MTPDAAESQSNPHALRDNGMPHGVPWPKGQTGNAGGISKYQRQLRAAIEAEETPERVLEVLDAMRTQALKGMKSSPAAAKVYLGAVGVSLTPPPAKIDLSNAPDEVVTWLVENKQ